MRSMGNTAKTQLTTNFRNTVGGFKALIGRQFSDPIVQNEMKGIHYVVEQLPGDQVGIKVGGSFGWVWCEHGYTHQLVSSLL